MAADGRSVCLCVRVFVRLSTLPDGLLLRCVVALSTVLDTLVTADH